MKKCNNPPAGGTMKPFDSVYTERSRSVQGKQWNNKAFTLLELLVVISIISILVTLGLSSFATAQKKGRDAKRKSDLKEVQTALEQYYSVCGFQYPTPSGTFYSSIICTTPGVSIAIMPTVRSDPRGVTPYYCSGTCNSTTYTICAGLESEAPTPYCLSNQQ